MLAVTLQTTAAGMRDQARGEFAAAVRQYSAAAAMLPPGLRRLALGDQCSAILTPEPVDASLTDLPTLIWRAARVIWRQQWLVADLIRILVRFPRPRDHLIEAYVQFMFEVEFSPFCWYRPPKGVRPDPEVTPSRDDLCRRAGNLRKLARATRGDVSQSVWQDIGGHCGLRTAALTRLADRPLVPRTADIPVPTDVPVPRGRRRAWEHARQWKEDLDYYQEPA